MQRRFEQAGLDQNISFAATLPLHVDIGCGKGHFCADLATARPDLNVLGIEIREPLVEEASRLVELAGTPNLRFIAGSANVLAAACCDQLQVPLSSASIQFPDPWPKRRHQKRRVVQVDLVRQLAARMQLESGLVFVQSDVEELADEMRACFLSSGFYDDADAAELGPDGWLRDEARPWPTVRTERERQAERRGLNVWRASLRRNAQLAHEKDV